MKMISPNGKTEVDVLPEKVDEMIRKGWTLADEQPDAEVSDGES